MMLSNERSLPPLFGARSNANQRHGSSLSMPDADKDLYDSPREALAATDVFYRAAAGFSYGLEEVKSWLSTHVRIPKAGRVLDLCCGDGIWSKGFQELSPQLELYGIDISAGGIDKARELLGEGRTGEIASRFVVGDAESGLPWPKSHFDLIFARGPGLFNQHDFARPASVRVLEDWHSQLSERGRFYSVFASTPRLMGRYTPMKEVVLPYNRAQRQSRTVEFEGGKFHHSIESFHRPFWYAENVEIVSYSFERNQHILVTRWTRGAAGDKSSIR
jgi:SAM-dependent methyltransferase